MSYDPDSTAPLDKARGELGDTNTSNELLTDDHIELWLTTEGYNGGIAYLANELAARFAQKPGRVTLPSGLSVAWAERVTFWQDKAKEYRGYAALEAAEAASVSRVSVGVPIRVVW